MTTAIQKVEAGCLMLPEKPRTTAQILERAVEMGASPESLDRLIDLHQKVMKIDEEKAFNEAMLGFQAENRVILKTVMGAKAKYTPLSDILTLVQPSLTRHGLTYEFTEGDSKPGTKCAVCIVKKGSHEKRTQFSVRVNDVKGSSGGSIMNDTQQDCAAFTSAQRIAFQLAFGILTADTDKAGQVAMFKGSALGALSDRKTAKDNLWNVLKPVRGTELKWDLARRWIVDEIDPDCPPIADMDAEQLNALAAKCAESLKGGAK